MIYVMNADGSNQEPAFVGHFNGGAKPEWSPDAVGLLFETSIDGNSEIYVVNVDGSGLTNISNNSDNDFQGRWQPIANTTPLPQNAQTQSNKAAQILTLCATAEQDIRLCGLGLIGG
jgi:hypothetical protein